MKKILGVVLVAILIFACGQLNQDKSKPLGGRYGTITQNFVDKAVNQHTNFFLAFSGTTEEDDLEKFGEMYLRAFRRTLFKMASGLLDTCTPINSGNNADLDNDEVPANATMSINCAAGSEYITGSINIIDEDDNKDLGQGLAGLAVTFNPIDLKVAMNSSFLLGTLNPGGFNVFISPTRTTMAVDVSGRASFNSAEAIFAAKGSGTYSGDVSNPQNGDTGSGSVAVKYNGINVAGLPNQDFVIEVNANFSMGSCAPSTTVTLKEGEATAIDGTGNIVRLVAANCDLALTYNGNSITIPN